MARRLAGLLSVGVLAGVLVGLARAGQGRLAPPPASPSGWVTWASERTAVEVAAAVLRLALVVAVGYLLAVTALGVGAALLRRRGAVVEVARWSPPAVRWLLGAWLAGSLAVGTAGGATAAGPPPTMVLLPDDEPSPAPAAPAPAPTPPPPAAATITLAPGDHLWSVAARTLAAAWGRPAGDREVAPYWRLLVDLNRSSLPNPSDPDLVFPGEVIRLPPVPP